MLVMLLFFGLLLVHLGQCTPISVDDEDQGLGLQRAITFTEPTKPLQFRKSVRKRPGKKNLKMSRLLRKMGTDFKPEWMSIDEPVNSDIATVCFVLCSLHKLMHILEWKI